MFFSPVQTATKFNTVPQKICITTTSSKTPIHATVLKNVLPVSLKNTQTGGSGNVAAESGNGGVGVSNVASSSVSVANVVNPVSTVAAAATPSTSYASGSGTTTVNLPTVMVSTSVISLSSPSTKLSNSISQIVQNSGGKSVILATSNSVNKPLTSTATSKFIGGSTSFKTEQLLLQSDINESVICAVKTSGQKVILKNIGPGNLNTILGPIIRKPSAQQVGCHFETGRMPMLRVGCYEPGFIAHIRQMKRARCFG